MTEWVFAQVPNYGPWIIFLATFLSCLAIPIPSSLIMLAGGAFAASGDLSFGTICAAAWAGAVLGDQAGYRLGAKGGQWVQRTSSRSAKAVQTIAAARAFMDRTGFWSVFLSRWLFSPLGPYINFLSGASRLDWRRFTLGSLTGEAIWVAAYVGMGAAFSGQITQVAELASDTVGLLAAAAVTALLGVQLVRARKQHRDL